MVIIMRRFFNDGETVLFQGDSITDCGRNRDVMYDLGSGYPKTVKTLYDTLFPNNDVIFVNKGISGNRARDLLTRYDEDFLAVKPDFVSILIGINDTWRRYDSGDITSSERFADEYEGLLIKIKKDMPNTKIMLMVPFLIHSQPDKIIWHEDLDLKVIAVYELGKKYADFVLPLDRIFEEAVTSGEFTPAEISGDGVHPESLGHSIIAANFLKALEII